MYQNDNILEKMIETYIIMNDLYSPHQCNKVLKQLATQIDYLATDNRTNSIESYKNIYYLKDELRRMIPVELRIAPHAAKNDNNAYTNANEDIATES